MSDEQLTSNQKNDAAPEAPPSESKKSKSTPSKKDRKQERSSGIGTWFKEIKAEFGKIIWPNKKELAKMTLTVIVTSLLFGVVIAGMDSVFSFVVGLLADLI